MNDTYIKFGRILSYYRNLKGFTQSEVADRMEMTQSAYAYYELGKRKISLPDIMKLSDILDFNVNEVMDDLKNGVSPEEPPKFNHFSEFDDEEFSPEEVTEISNFIKYVIWKRG